MRLQQPGWPDAHTLRGLWTNVRNRVNPQQASSSACSQRHIMLLEILSAWNVTCCRHQTTTIDRHSTYCNGYGATRGVQFQFDQDKQICFEHHAWGLFVILLRHPLRQLYQTKTMRLHIAVRKMFLSFYATFKSLFSFKN